MTRGTLYCLPPSSLHPMPLSGLIKLFGRKKPTGHFLGGKPLLPPATEVPLCKDCGSRQTFFFHFKLASLESLSSKAISIFACTSCCTPENLIPQMVAGPLKGASISSEYLSRYQTNFRAVVFEASEGVEVPPYEETLLFQAIEQDAEGNLRIGNERIGRLGGAPAWLQGNETPGLCDGKHAFQFLFQIFSGCKFKTKPTAPRQMKLGLSGHAEPSGHPYYQLFIGDAFYAFGVDVKGECLVYFIPQV